MRHVQLSTITALALGGAFVPALAQQPAAAPKALTCTTAELWAGNPNHDDPMLRAKDGAGLREDPPLGWRSLVFSGTTLFTTVGQEIWMTDTSAAKPTVKRVAGREEKTGQAYRGGACKDARFANVFGLAVLSDGSLVGADQTANGMFRVKDPTGAKCTVELLAGTVKPQESVSPGRPPNVGDVDGAGASAKFSLPMWPAVGPNDVVYFLDSNVQKVKALSNDAAHTVKTVAKVPDAVYHALVVVQGKVYALANNSRSEAFILEVDPATGTTREVIKGRADVFEGSGSINPSGLTTDGKGLIMWHSGVLLYVTVDGTVTRLAGTGDYFGFKGAYDPLIPHKASELQLVASRRHATAGTSTFLAWQPGAVFVGNSVKNAYVEKVLCE